MSRKRDELTDEQWQQLEPLRPAQKPNRGRPNLEHRTVIHGILWILKTGAPWRDLPERYGKWQTVASRFYRWQQSGVWERIFAQLQQTKDRDGQINWEVHYVDGSIIRAHQHAAGAKKSTPEAEALGRSQGGFSTKLHVRAEGGGKLMTFVLTAGERHELSVAETLVEQGAVKRAGRGRPKRRPKRIVGDKGYGSRKFRRFLRQHGIRYTIPRKVNEHRGGSFDRQIYRQRNRVERLLNRLKHFRRIATRYEKRAVNYAAMLTVAAIVLWL